MSSAPALKLRGITTGKWMTIAVDRRGIRAIGMLVKTRRESLRLSQFALADAAPVQFRTLANLESGITRSPHLRSVVRILGALGYDVVVVGRENGGGA